MSGDVRLGEQDDIRHRLTVGGRGQLFVTTAAMAASFVLQVWIARALGPLGLGEYHATSLLVMILATGTLFGLPVALTQRVAHLDERADARLSDAIGTGRVLGVALAVIAGLLAALAWPAFSDLAGIESPAPTALVGIAAASAAVQFVAVAILLGKLAYAALLVLVLAQPGAVTAGAVMVVVGAPLNGSTLAALGFVGAGIAGAWQLSRLPAGRTDPSEAKHLFVHAVPAALITYGVVFAPWLERAVLLGLLGPAALGVFAAASSFPDATLRVIRAGSGFAVTVYARLIGDPVGSSRVLDSHIRLASAALIVAGAALVAAGPDLLTAVFGDAFGQAGTALRLLAIALLPMALGLALMTGTIGGGERRGPAVLLALIVPSQLLLVFIGTKLFSIAGTALAALILWTAAAAFQLTSARRSREMRPATALHIAGVAVPVWSLAWIIGVEVDPVIIRAAVAIVGSTIAVSLVLLGDAERRLMSRFVGRRAASSLG